MDRDLDVAMEDRPHGYLVMMKVMNKTSEMVLSVLNPTTFEPSICDMRPWME
jgi:hypothetical protein